MKSFKSFLKEDALDDRLAAQKKRQEDESKLETTLKNHYTGLDKHHDTLRNFTKDSLPINSSLWDKTNVKADEVKNLDAAISLHKTPEAFTVWSKTRHDPRLLKDKNDMVHHPAYISTSIQKHIPETSFASRNKVFDAEGNEHHHILKIAVPKGHAGVYIPDEHSIDNRAKEFILPRGLNIKYKDTNTQKDRHRFYHTHEMELE